MGIAAWVLQVTEQVHSVISVRTDLALGGPRGGGYALSLRPIGTVIKNGDDHVKSSRIAERAIDERDVSPQVPILAGQPGLQLGQKIHV